MMDNDRIHIKYPFRVWLITVFATPFILLFAEGINSNTTFESFITDVPYFFVIVLSSAVCAIPSLLLFWLCYRKIRLFSISVWKKKMLLSIIGTISIFLTFLTINDSFLSQPEASVIIWLSSYAISLVAAVFIKK